MAIPLPRQLKYLIGTIILLVLVREIVRYVLNWWIAFCVFYTMRDLYKKRYIVKRYYRMCVNLGIIPDLFKKPKKLKAVKIKQ